MPDVFKIRIMKTGGAGECKIFAESKVGRAEADSTADKDLVDRIAPFHKEMGRIANARRADLNEVEPAADQRDLGASNPAALQQAERLQARRRDLKITAELGESLFGFLFQADVERLFRDSMRESFSNDEALPIRIFVESLPELSGVPWETLYDQKTRGFLALSRQTPIIRAAQRDVADLTWKRKSRLRILGMVARPREAALFSLDHIDAEEEQRVMQMALQKLQDLQKIDLHWTLSGRRSDLEDAVIRPHPFKPWNVFHFIGHGGFDPDEGRGYLVVQEEEGVDADLLYSGSLRNTLVGPNCPQLVVLNSCKGAFTGANDLFSSTAADLALGGIPAVIAMQFVVSDKFAIAFSKKFYDCLAKGDSIGTALAVTRSNLQDRKFTEWMAPVLYLGGVDSPMFLEGTTVESSL
ncbi:CHAT domain-containing protein [Bradyrhizobium sp. 956_D2_N1_5]|uniref:CHAT domain-containing protein n=1 Tax=unclassified Bradyrhizobium TaxID=2631580 RepID=UPI003F2281F5